MVENFGAKSNEWTSRARASARIHLSKAGWDVREAGYKALRRFSGESPWSVTKNSVSAYWFRKHSNFGDKLSPLLLRMLTGFEPVWVQPKFPAKILGLGSIVESVAPGDLVVGAGLIKDAPHGLPKGVKVLAVRGPLTAERLGLDPERVAFGDPGLLAAEAFGVTRTKDPNGIVVIPHFRHKEAAGEALRRVSNPKDITIIDVQQDPVQVVQKISRARVCVSTSLHGIIIAESLGIPAVWATTGEELIGGEFKFHDYFLGTGRQATKAVELLDGVESARSSLGSETFKPDSSGIRGALTMLTEHLAVSRHRPARRSL